MADADQGELGGAEQAEAVAGEGDGELVVVLILAGLVLLTWLSKGPAR